MIDYTMYARHHDGAYRAIASTGELEFAHQHPFQTLERAAALAKRVHDHLVDNGDLNLRYWKFARRIADFSIDPKSF